MPGLDVLQVSGLLDKEEGQAVVFQHHVPVVADGDGRGDHPGAVHVLALHPVEPRRDAGQGLAAALFPLQEGIPLLEDQVDVVELDFIETDFFHQGGVPEGEPGEPFPDSGIFLHLRKGAALAVVLLAFLPEQTLVSREGSWIVVQYCLIDRDGEVAAVVQYFSGGGAISPVNEFVIPLYQEEPFFFGRGDLFPQGFAQVGENLLLRNPYPAPFFEVHAVRLALGIEAVEVFAAFGIKRPGGGVHPDLVEQLLGLVAEIPFCRVCLCQLQQYLCLVVLQCRFGVG